MPAIATRGPATAGIVYRSRPFPTRPSIAVAARAATSSNEKKNEELEKKKKRERRRAKSMLALRAFAAAACCATIFAVPGLSAPITCGSSSGPIYSVSLDDQPLFSSPPALSAFMDGARRSSWVLVQSTPVTSADSLGAFSGTECAYALAAAPSAVVFTAAAYTYASAAAAPSASLVRFTYSLPRGAARTNHSAPSPATYSTVANFPAFAGPATPLAKILTWRDAFFGPSNSVADSLGQIASAMVFFGGDVAGRAVSLAPLDNFLNHALGDDLGDGRACSGTDAGCWAAGASATVTALPAGFTHSVLLVADTGITRTFDSWGRVMRAFYGTTKLADTSLTTLGYQTDNGAQLCFGCPKQILDSCLLDEKAHLDALAVPIKYLSFQNAWWEAGGESAPWCVGEWVPVPAKVPMGMQGFQKALGLPLQLYAPYFCATTSYVANFSMVRSDATLPGCRDFDFYDASPEGSREFYEFLLGLGQDYGMTMFEPDFLNANHVCVPRFIEEVGAAARFFDGQTGVAAEKNIPIQWCFATSMLLMYTLTAPAVTNFRVSYDYYYGGSWDTGRSSLIVWAMGGAPSKDTFWTTDNGNQSTTRGACDKKGCPPDHSTPAATLHTMLTVLSTGPVGFSDAPGETDAVLIGRTCDANGTLLQPSKPLTACDSTHDAAGAAPAGFCLSTYTAVGGAPWLHLLLTHQLSKPFAVRALDLYPALVAGATYAVGEWDALRACSGGGACGVTTLVAPADAHATLRTLPAVAAGADPFYPTLTLFAPLCAPSGLALFGEVDKIATISVQRFPGAAQCTPGGLTFSLQGVAGETIRLSWFDATAAVLLTGNASFAAGATRLDCSIAAAGGGLQCAAALGSE